MTVDKRQSTILPIRRYFSCMNTIQGWISVKRCTARGRLLSYSELEVYLRTTAFLSIAHHRKICWNSSVVVWEIYSHDTKPYTGTSNQHFFHCYTSWGFPKPLTSSPYNWWQTLSLLFYQPISPLHDLSDLDEIRIGGRILVHQNLYIFEIWIKYQSRFRST